MENDIEKTDEVLEEVPDSDKKSVGRKISSGIVELLIYCAIMVLCITFVPRYVLQRTIVSGSSMESTLHNNENLLVEKV